jgi:hypothetical protein
MIIGYTVWLRNRNSELKVDATRVEIDTDAGQVRFLSPIRPISRQITVNLADLAAFRADEERDNFKLRFKNSHGAVITVRMFLEKGNAPELEEKFVVIRPPGESMPRAMIARDLLVDRLTDLFV